MASCPDLIVNVDLSLKDYFAAAALQGLCTYLGPPDSNKTALGYAGHAYLLADVMLARREAEKIASES